MVIRLESNFFTMNTKIKLLDQTFEFRKSSYSYKDFEDRNKRPYNPSLASDILEYIYSCIVAGYFYKRIDCPLDLVGFYELIDLMEEQDAELLYKDNSKLFQELFNLGTSVETEDPAKKK